MANMVRNAAIAEQVAERLKDILTPEAHELGRFGAGATGQALEEECEQESDTTQIAVADRDPYWAAAIGARGEDWSREGHCSQKARRASDQTPPRIDPVADTARMRWMQSAWLRRCRPGAGSCHSTRDTTPVA